MAGEVSNDHTEGLVNLDKYHIGTPILQPSDIIRIRESLSLTQQELSDKLGVDRTILAKWEMPTHIKSHRKINTRFAVILIRLQKERYGI